MRTRRDVDDDDDSSSMLSFSHSFFFFLFDLNFSVQNHDPLNMHWEHDSSCHFIIIVSPVVSEHSTIMCGCFICLVFNFPFYHGFVYSVACIVFKCVYVCESLTWPVKILSHGQKVKKFGHYMMMIKALWLCIVFTQSRRIWNVKKCIYLCMISWNEMIMANHYHHHQEKSIKRVPRSDKNIHRERQDNKMFMSFSLGKRVE